MKWWDKSWNPLSGCTPCSEGCRNCVALRNLQKRGRSLLPFFNEHLSRNNLGTGISYAVGSLGDLFHEAQSRGDIDKVFSRMALYPGNRYFILTKRSAGMKRYFEDVRLPENIRNHPWDSLWLGVTVEDRNCLHRVDDLIAAPVVGHRFLCLEPLLEAVSIAPQLASGAIEWVIVGSESGEKRRPADPEWVRGVIRECRSHNVPVYVDQLEGDGCLLTEASRFPEEFRIREIPWKAGLPETDYSGLPVLDGEGWAGVRENEGGLEFLFRAPEFIFRFWKETFGNVGEAELEPPFFYLTPKGPSPVRKLFREVHETASNAYCRLAAQGVPAELASRLLPGDVITRFRWYPGEGRAELRRRLELEAGKELRHPELRQYFRALRLLCGEVE